MTNYKFENTIGGKLFAKLQKATADCIEYKGKSLDEWDSMCQSVDAKKARNAKKRDIKRKGQENIKNYRDQVDKLSRRDTIGQFIDLSGELDRSEVHVDADAQYRANIAFASAASIDLED